MLHSQLRSGFSGSSWIGNQLSCRRGPSPLPSRDCTTTAAASEGPTSVYKERLFGNIAPVYDQLNDTLSLGQHRIWKQLAVQEVGAKSRDRLLDVCCGSGDLARLLANAAGPNGEVVAVDFAGEMLEYAKQKSRDQSPSYRQIAGIQWIKGDALSLPLDDEQFDGVTMGYGLRNVDSIPVALTEVHRVLKPGKKAVFLDFNNSRNQVISSLQSWALQNVVVPAAQTYGLGPEYEYLQPSIKRFPSGRQQEVLARGAGFIAATHFELAFGLMGLLVAEK